MGVQVEPPTRDTENASREMLDHFGKILDFRKKMLIGRNLVLSYYSSRSSYQ